MGLVALQHVKSSRTRDGTHVPCIDRQILIYCTTREVRYLSLDVSFCSFILAVPHLCCYVQAFSSCGARGLLSSCDAWTSHEVASFVAEYGLEGAQASVVGACGLRGGSPRL